jgi:hypothetical protein
LVPPQSSTRIKASAAAPRQPSSAIRSGSAQELQIIIVLHDRFADTEQYLLSRPAEKDVDLGGNRVRAQQYLVELESVVYRWHLLDAPVTVVHRPRFPQVEVNLIPRLAGEFRYRRARSSREIRVNA